MKLIKENKKVESLEQSMEERKKLERDAMTKALDDFRKSSAYPYVMKFFREYEEQITNEIQTIQNEEMKRVFLLPTTKQREKISEMSKRDSILTGVLGTLKRIKNKL